MPNNVVKVSSAECIHCPVCQAYILDGSTISKFNASCDHMMDEHGYTLAYVGNESVTNAKGETHQTAVAVLSKQQLTMPPLAWRSYSGSR